MAEGGLTQKQVDRYLEVLSSEFNNLESLLWLSFCDSDRPKGQQFLGVIIIRAKGLAHAMLATNRLGINPGGEVQMVRILPQHEHKVDPTHLVRLLSRQDLIEGGYIT